jgi:2-keto-3-deoxy-L-rhamnonate aldolase RhmA
MKTFGERLQAGEVVFGATVMEYLRPSLVKTFCNAGFDFIFIEIEHALFSPERLSDFILCVRDHGLPVVAKLGQLERAATARLLEAGTLGIQLPRTESLDDLEQLQSFMKYSPLGTRASATGYGNSAYVKPKNKRQWYDQMNDETFLVAHIETRKGVENIEEIVSLPGLDICLVGTSDLSLDYGKPGDYKSTEFRALVQQVFDAAQKQGVARGIPASDYDTVKYWIEHGVQFFECATELDLLRAGASKTIEDLHRARDASVS